jgi:hypothetical protein
MINIELSSVFSFQYEGVLAAPLSRRERESMATIPLEKILQ